MAGPLGELVKCWIAWGGIDAALAPDPVALASAFRGGFECCRPGAAPQMITAWEDRHGYRLPHGLKAWLRLSNGLFGSGPFIHPIAAIGPMIPFAGVPEMMVQPDSWFELGNPGLQTICIDLGYRLPGGSYPIFTSGDDSAPSCPRLIARSFEEWFLALLRQGGREYWFDPGFRDLGDPWESHRRHVIYPALSGRLQPFAERAARLVHTGADERKIASTLGLSHSEVESILRYLQHASPTRSAQRAAGS
jgi:hypothetical protein